VSPPAPDKPRLAIAVIPAHNEGPRIQPVVQGARPALPVVVVDDGSTDDTAAIAEAAGATVIRQRPNQGKGAALRAGFRHALATGADAVVTLDADGQHDPAEIPRLLAASDGTAIELVIGARAFGEMPLVRRLSNSIGTVALSAALGRWVPDNQSGYRVLGRRLMTAMLDSHEDGFAFEVEMIAVCLREGWPIAWTSVRTIYGDERSHIRPLHHFRGFLAVTARARRISRGARLS
jgi:glycosyltransferase involved in cell wall biosynthesis